MELSSLEILKIMLNGFFLPITKNFLNPTVIFWIIIPSLIGLSIFRNKEGLTLGATLGAIALFTVN